MPARTRIALIKRSFVHKSPIVGSWVYAAAATEIAREKEGEVRRKKSLTLTNLAKHTGSMLI